MGPEIEELRKKMAQHDPNSFQALRIQAILDLSDHKMDEALAGFAKANSVKPHSRDLVGWYAEALVTGGHADQAESRRGGQDGRWRPTPRGLRFLNELLLEFLPDPATAADPALSRA